MPTDYVKSGVTINIGTPILPALVSVTFGAISFSSNKCLGTATRFKGFSMLPVISQCTGLSTLVATPSVSCNETPQLSPVL